MAKASAKASKIQAGQLYNLILLVYVVLFVIYVFELRQIQSAFALNMINFATALLITHVAQAVLVILPMIFISVMLLLNVCEKQ